MPVATTCQYGEDAGACRRSRGSTISTAVGALQLMTRPKSLTVCEGPQTRNRPAAQPRVDLKAASQHDRERIVRFRRSAHYNFTRRRSKARSRSHLLGTLLRRNVLFGLANVPVFSCGRQSEPQASDKPVCCNTLLGGDPAKCFVRTRKAPGRKKSTEL
jgi:hypothetical protein